MRLRWPMLLAALLAAGPAAAQPAGCTVSIDPLVFADYDVFAQEAARASSEVQVRCHGLALVDHVELSTGQSANYQQRTMSTAGGYLAYNIYADPAAQRIAGDGTGGTVVVVNRHLTRNASPLQRFILYGRIPPRQVAPAGDYVDVVQVIVVF